MDYISTNGEVYGEQHSARRPRGFGDQKYVCVCGVLFKNNIKQNHSSIILLSLSKLQWACTW